MGRHIKISNIKMNDSSTDRILIIDFGDSPIIEWCLELILLKEDLCDSISITDNDYKYKIILSKTNNLPRNDRARINFQKDKIILEITNTELEYWINFFLKYYRDGLAEVDHFDIEVLTNPNEKNIQINFQVANYSLPVSEEEALKRLGLNLSIVKNISETKNKK